MLECKLSGIRWISVLFIYFRLYRDMCSLENVPSSHWKIPNSVKSFINPNRPEQPFRELIANPRNVLRILSVPFTNLFAMTDFLRNFGTINLSRSDSNATYAE